MPDSNLYFSSLLLGLSNQDFLLFLMDPIPDLSCDHKKKQKMKNLFSPESIIIAVTFFYICAVGKKNVPFTYKMWIIITKNNEKYFKNNNSVLRVYFNIRRPTMVICSGCPFPAILSWLSYSFFFPVRCPVKFVQCSLL
jgi:hypothetical protein